MPVNSPRVPPERKRKAQTFDHKFMERLVTFTQACYPLSQPHPNRLPGPGKGAAGELNDDLSPLFPGMSRAQFSLPSFPIHFCAIWVPSFVVNFVVEVINQRRILFLDQKQGVIVYLAPWFAKLPCVQFVFLPRERILNLLTVSRAAAKWGFRWSRQRFLKAVCWIASAYFPLVGFIRKRKVPWRAFAFFSCPLEFTLKVTACSSIARE